MANIAVKPAKEKSLLQCGVDQLPQNFDRHTFPPPPSVSHHLDNKCNFLIQIRDEKDLFVFNQSDRQVLRETELERFWVGDWNAGEYKARCQERSHCFRLAPGRAVHIPVNAPHWVKNDQN